MAIAIPAAMTLFWSRLYPNSPRYSSGIVWAVTILLLMPVTTHTMRSNALELLIAFIGILAAVCAWEGKSRTGWLAIVAALSAVGFLVKGPVGLFPLAMPFVFAAVVENQVVTGFRRSTVSSIICLAMLSSLLIYEPARIHFTAYFDNQILASLTGLRGNENDRIYLLQHFGLNLAVPIFLTLVVFASRSIVLQRQPSVAALSLPSRETIALIAIGLIASAPLLLSPRHYRHYLFPCLPFFALAAAMIVHPKMHLKPRWSRLLVLTLFLAVTTRTFLNFGLPGKDVTMLNSLQVAASHVSRAGTNQLGFCHPDPVRQSYLHRQHRIQSTNQVQTQTPVWFCTKGTKPANTELLAELADGNVLWRRISPTDR
ncbi:MAG: hypothetical protein GKR90_06975 [Pseudomonadales bacterium]|nr:hypothetical protein [Pseudomonadales bacterium]